MRKELILFALIFLVPDTGNTKPYESEFYYPDGEGPFPAMGCNHLSDCRPDPAGSTSYEDTSACKI